MDENAGMTSSPFASLTDPTITDINTQRRNFRDFENLANSRLPPLPEALEEYWTEITLTDSWSSRTLVVRPKPVVIDSFAQYPRITTSRTPKRPLMILFHGGGFITGSPLQLAHPARLFAHYFNVTVICPSYRVAPEHPWPAAMKDGLEFVQTVASQVHLLQGANPSHGLIVGGISTGATIAAIVAGLICSDPVQYPLARPLTGVYLSIPILFTESIVPHEYHNVWKSRTENFQSRYPNVETITKEMGCTDTDFQSEWFSPVNLLSGENPRSTRYPPTYLQAGGLDPVRDDAVVLEKILAVHQVSTKLDIFPNDGHDALSSFNMVLPTRSSEPTMEDGTLDGIAWLLRSGHSTRT